jgi:hypothetical protein
VVWWNETRNTPIGTAEGRPSTVKMTTVSKAYRVRP